jgi:glycosyltransferase involved in cell wall biosynthesis
MFNNLPNRKNFVYLSILTPIFLNSVGGASVYYRSLTKELLNHNYKITVFSELCGKSTTPEGVKVRWFFPCRSGLDPKSYKNIALYAIQNLMYFFLIFRIGLKTKTLLIHSSFINYPGLFLIFIRLLKLFRPKLHLVLDVRDNLMPLSKRKKLILFDRIICCSEQILLDYKSISNIQKKLVHIPILLTELNYSSARFSHNRLHLKSATRYIFYAGTIKESKNIHILINAFLNFVHPKITDITLVLAGELKTSNTNILRSLEGDNINYLGPVSNEDVKSLIHNSCLCINLSENEGLPRFSLEVVAAGTPLLFAAGVLEFDKYCPSFSIRKITEENVANRILDALNNRHTCSNYPVQSHYKKNIIGSYISVFNSL